MDRALAEYFVEEASKAFGFLVAEYGFAGPTLEIDERIHFAFVTFMAKELAVECILDEREADITCKIARVVGGRKTPHYSVDERGLRVREYLSTLLAETRRGPVRLTKVTGLDLWRRIPITLGDFARMLKEHGQDILRDSPEVLA
jgi:hypothetical protein